MTSSDIFELTAATDPLTTKAPTTFTITSPADTGSHELMIEAATASGQKATKNLKITFDRPSARAAFENSNQPPTLLGAKEF